MYCMTVHGDKGNLRPFTTSAVIVIITLLCSPIRKDRRMERGVGKKKRNAQLTLPPPPRHCPVWTIVVRPPSAALGRLSCPRTVCEPGIMCDRKSAGCMCAGSLCVVGPASSTRMRRSVSAVARRPATTQPAVPPSTHASSLSGAIEGECG